jgi:PAS domain S-box-containing protein
MLKKTVHSLTQRYRELSPKSSAIASFGVFFAIVLVSLVVVVASMNKSSAHGELWNFPDIQFLVVFITGSLATLLIFWFAKHLQYEKQLNQSLHLAEEQYLALIDQPLVGVAKVDARSGQYLAVNEAFCAMTGYTAQEVLAMTLYDITHPDDREYVQVYLTGRNDSLVNSPHTFQKRYLHKDGRTVYAVISSHSIKNAHTGNVERIALIQDVTASIESNAVLKEQENRLSIIIHNSMDAIITIDTSETILIFNAAAEAMFGYLMQDALKMPLSALIPHAQRSGHHTHVQAFSQSGDTARKMGAKLILKGLRANGEEFPLDASISRAVSDGKVYMTVILRDLTKQVKAQNELDRARAELREISIASQTAREEEKARISRELHDELGQNLTALKMDLSWLQAHTPSDASANILERIRAMQGVLDSTVVATRRIAADLRPMMLDDLGLKAALEWLVQDFTQRLTVPCELLIDEDVIELDTRVQSALYRAVQECLTNIARHAHATQVHIELHMSPAKVTLQIRDNGVGMVDEARGKRGSFGLIGMRERIYILDGEVAIVSQIGKGTCITISLPRLDSTEEVSITK